MSVEQINITLGTAGHIDHGKTALVKCLTGCETDRLKAEKERGMSIDLGFAPCKIADMEVGIVDVPGHENFVKTMVAGASGMDGVILVVAADDAVMPQTREHLEILTLLGVRHGLVAMTKIDRVDSDHLQLALAETEEFLQGTFLETAPILPLSNVTGEGFGPFLEALAALVAEIGPKPLDGVFRLPIDRAFSAKGYGTIVAGIPVAGQARIGDEVVLLPDETSGQIRRIQVYGHDADAVLAGQCAALNVRQWEPRAVQRGHTAATPGFFSAERWYACSLRLLPHDKLYFKSGTRVKLHTGTSEVVAAIYPMQGGVVNAGETTLVQVRTETPIVAAPADPFILRTLSPVRTVGGGTVIEAVPGRLKRNRPNVCEDLQRRALAVGDAGRFVEYCLKSAAGSALKESDLSVRVKLLPDRLGSVLETLLRDGTVVRLPSRHYLHRDAEAAARQRILDTLAAFHRESPQRPGMTGEELHRSCGLEKAVLKPVLAGLSGEGRVVERNQRLALAEHRPTFGGEEAEYLDAIESLFRHRAFRPPTPEQLAGETGAAKETVKRVIRILIEHQKLIVVADGLVFHRQAVDQAREKLVAHIRAEGRLESVQFKYVLDTTRKYAIPLLDYLDKTGLTRRVGNTRYLKET
jgi:selenocysteine-specific elongation factor